NGKDRSALIPILQEIQSRFRYLPKQALQCVCNITNISRPQITGVSTFYNHFRHTPMGKHTIQVCHGTACHIKGAPVISDSIRRHLDIEEESDTDSDELFTVEKVACFGCCILAPVVKIDDIYYDHVTQQGVPDMIKSFIEEQNKKPDKKGKKDKRSGKEEDKVEIYVGWGSCCVGYQEIKNAFDKVLLNTGINAETKRVGCVGVCYRTPWVEFVDRSGTKGVYGNVKPEAVPAILYSHLKPKGFGQRLISVLNNTVDTIFSDEDKEDPSLYSVDREHGEVCTFLEKQTHIALKDGGKLEPLDVEEYCATEGFKALEKCLKEMTPEQVIEETKKSGLRGRGGAGFPTGLKWELARSQEGEKYLICNGDEGDPGAFMDHMLLESFPYRVLEGMAIAAYAIGVNEGYLYIRHEYPLAVDHIRRAIRIAEETGYLGKNILGTDFSLKLHVMQGAGAFVAGEETALIASIEGNRAMPRVRPPYPTVKGLWGKPTNINNVETFANVPWIINHGSEAFASYGTERSKGTKVFALAGKVGLIEVPMGITIHEIVEDIGGGVKEGRTFKAVQIGGPSGGCVPAKLGDTPIDFEDIVETGAIMGSGGLVVLDDTDCMVEVARFFLEFTQDQSCGRCTFCRIGTKRMLEILERLCAGKAKKDDLEKLEYLADQVKKGALCGLGGTAPNPVLTTLRHFHDEYEAHLEGRCPALQCIALITYRVTDDCIGCTLCSQNCPVDAIEFNPYEKHEIDPEKCIRCGTCMNVCPSDAIKKDST
ncbi:NAD(P)H-dependent oxidoreductase subunit E, partial [Planctomycetota bacterium]